MGQIRTPNQLMGQIQTISQRMDHPQIISHHMVHLHILNNQLMVNTQPLLRLDHRRQEHMALGDMEIHNNIQEILNSRIMVFSTMLNIRVVFMETTLLRLPQVGPLSQWALTLTSRATSNRLIMGLKVIMAGNNGTKLVFMGRRRGLR